MKGHCFELRAEPKFYEVVCPKHRIDMIELDNGWFSTCWYCKKCGYPYELEMRKILKVNKENLAKLLKEYKLKHPLVTRE